METDQKNSADTAVSLARESAELPRARAEGRPDHYEPETLSRAFHALLADTDYHEEMDILDISRLHPIRRKMMQQEFRALYVGLWHLALTRSFPDDHAAILRSFLEQETADLKKPAEQAAVTDRILRYVGRLGERGDTDFSEVSRHLLSRMEFDESRIRALVLKLALHLRRMYTHFFNNLLWIPLR
jgi:hypothetical protein